MALIPRNSLFHGARGKLGDVVFKVRGGRTYVSACPEQDSEREATPAQKKVQKNFVRCAKYAKSVMDDPIKARLYVAAAAWKNRSVYNVAFKDAANPPKVESIKIFPVTEKANNHVLVAAKDDFKVDRVIVSIHSAKGRLIEGGPAMLHQVSGIYWSYFTKKKIKNITGYTIKATAYDLPGNEASLEVKV